MKQYMQFLVFIVIISMLTIGCDSVVETFEETKTLESSDFASVQSIYGNCDIIVPDDYGTIQAAINAATVGQTICVAAGIYPEKLIVNKDGLTLQGDGSYPEVKPELNSSNKYDAVITVSASNVTIRGLSISNALGVVDDGEGGTHIEHSGIWQGVWNPPFPEQLTVDDCIFHNTTHGVRWYGDGLTVTNSEFTALGRKGITVSHDTGIPKEITVLHNKFHSFTPTWRQNAAIIIKYRDWYGEIAHNTMSGMRFGLAIHNGGTRHGNQLVFHSNTIADLHSEGVNEGNEWGIDFWNNNAGINADNTIITNNSISGTNYAYVAQTASPLISYNCIFDNNYGIYFAGQNDPLNATYNWWGDASGPEHASNPGGTGDKIIGNNVNFDPWLTDGCPLDSLPDDPQTIDDCKKGGWEKYGFRNQGLCIQFVNTGRDSR